MVVKFLDLFQQYKSIQPEIDVAIQAIISKSEFIGGPAVKEFEVGFALYQQAEHCIGVANGTDALEIAIESLLLPPGSEIIVPANSFISSAEAVSRSGHKVVFADIDPMSFTISVEDAERRITEKTRVIIAVHLYGHSCDMDGLWELAKRYDLHIIEDCAQAHGAEYKSKRVGTLGHIGAFSFYPGKNLGAYGDAGAILTNNKELASRCRMIANHGRIDKYNHIMEGRNSRLDGLQAAILSVKLRYLDAWIDRRNVIARQYLDAFADIEDLLTPAVSDYVRHAFHLFVVRTSFREPLQQHLNQLGIETGIHYPIALPKLEAYAYLRQSSEQMYANKIDRELLSLPMGEHLTDTEVNYVIESVRSFFKK